MGAIECAGLIILGARGEVGGAASLVTEEVLVAVCGFAITSSRMHPSPTFKEAPLEAAVGVVTLATSGG